MNLTDQVALVTGANRGLVAEFVHELLAARVGSVYGCVRNVDCIAADVAADPECRC